MLSVSNIVTSTTALASAGSKVANFDEPLCVAYVTATEMATGAWGAGELVREYSSLAEMVAGGFTVNSAAYRGCQAFAMQEPSVSFWKLGRRTAAPVLTVSVTPEATPVANRLYECTVVGPTGETVTASYSKVTAPSAQEIVDGLYADLSAMTGLTFTHVTGVLVITATVSGDHFAVRAVTPGYLDVLQTQGAGDLAAELTAIQAFDKDFYGVTLTTGSKLEIEAAAAFCEANDKLGGFSTLDTVVTTTATTTSVMYSVNALHYNNSFIQYDPNALLTQGAARLLGAYLPNQPGTATAAFTQLTGVEDANLSQTQFNNIKANNGNVFDDVEGTSIVLEGKVAGGSYKWIDITRDLAYFNAQLKAALYDVFLMNKKVGYTNKGILMLVGAIKKTIASAITQGIASEDVTPTYSYPTAAEVSAADRSNRVLPDIKYSFQMGGAIHSVIVAGSITL